MKEWMREKQRVIQKLKGCMKLLMNNNKQHKMNGREWKAWEAANTCSCRQLKGVNKFTSYYGDSQGYVSWPNRKYLKMKQMAFLMLNMDVGEKFCSVDSGTTSNYAGGSSQCTIPQMEQPLRLSPVLKLGHGLHGFAASSETRSAAPEVRKTRALPSLYGIQALRAMLPQWFLPLRCCCLHSLSWRQV